MPSDAAAERAEKVSASPLTSLPDPLLLSHVLCRLDARSLARLNQTATSFCERRPESEGWGGRSIVDEAARLVYERRDDNAQCPPVPGVPYVRLLGELEQLAAPLGRTFSGGSHGDVGIESGEAGGAVVTKLLGANRANIGRGWRINMSADRGWGTAVCRGAVMRAGTHFAEFTVLRDQSYGSGILVGVCRADFRPTSELRATATAAGWGLSTATGLLRHNGDSRTWVGQQPVRVGETLGLLLDFSERKLTAYKNGERLGLVAAGSAWQGEDDGLTGAPLCWMVQLYYENDAVRVESKPCPCVRNPNSD